MKVIILVTILALCQGEVVIRVPGPDDFGRSIQYQNQDVLGNYNFGYDEGHPSGGSFRQEAGDVFGNKVGSYGLRDADGRVRIVNYVADSDGFRVDVKTNEPGVAPQDPASATINKAVGIVSGAVAPIPAPVIPLSAVPPAIPTVVKGLPVAAPSPVVSYPVPQFPPPVANLAVPTVKYPAPALQYPVPITAYPSVAPDVKYYGQAPYPEAYAAAPSKAIAAPVPVANYRFPVRLGYSGSPALPAYQVLQYPF